ncbi:sphingosine 1-phosphate receptor 5b isoform X2 [Denticeps clupeoides]|uniref:sphingosine 1-phosphate receptor 5b isoform X2 n=1 Tax=Denticeps clupeoides TaxID=299321 RepID=UPI0010A428CE|nr:sphingosine 1-phosphate receptor 1-like isoform X2 [Denticeps clupeoides]
MVEKRNLQHACRCHSDHEPNAVNSDYPGPFYRTMESSHASYIAQPSTGTPITPSTAFLCRYLQYQNNSVILQHYNYVGKLKQDKYEKGLKPEAIALLLVCLLIVLENSVVLVAIWKNKKFHLPMYYLLGNLTFSDLLAGFTYMLNIMLSGPMTLRLTPLLWFLREGGVYITLTASIISLLAIAIERHVTMAQMKPYQGTKRGRMFALIATSWALPVLLGVLPIMGWNCIGNLKQCSTILPLYNKSYILFCVIVFSSILVAIIVLYCRIYLDFMSTAKAHPVLLKADYFLGLAMINSLLNPVIYTLTSKDMRRAILRLLCQRCLMTQDGQMKAFGISFLECSFSKSVVASHRLQGLETTISSGNITHSHIKAIYPKLFVNKL